MNRKKLNRVIAVFSILNLMFQPVFPVVELALTVAVSAKQTLAQSPKTCDGLTGRHRNAGNGCFYTCSTETGQWGPPEACDGQGNGQFQGEAARTEEERRQQDEAVRQRADEAGRQLDTQSEAETRRVAEETASQRAAEEQKQREMAAAQLAAARAEADRIAAENAAKAEALRAEAERRAREAAQKIEAITPQLPAATVAPTAVPTTGLTTPAGPTPTPTATPTPAANVPGQAGDKAWGDCKLAGGSDGDCTKRAQDAYIATEHQEIVQYIEAGSTPEKYYQDNKDRKQKDAINGQIAGEVVRQLNAAGRSTSDLNQAEYDRIQQIIHLELPQAEALNSVLALDRSEIEKLAASGISGQAPTQISSVVQDILQSTVLPSPTAEPIGGSGCGSDNYGQQSPGPDGKKYICTTGNAWEVCPGNQCPLVISQNQAGDAVFSGSRIGDGCSGDGNFVTKGGSNLDDCAKQNKVCGQDGGGGTACLSPAQIGLDPRLPETKTDQYRWNSDTRAIEKLIPDGTWDEVKQCGPTQIGIQYGGYWDCRESGFSAEELAGKLAEAAAAANSCTGVSDGGLVRIIPDQTKPEENFCVVCQSGRAASTTACPSLQGGGNFLGPSERGEIIRSLEQQQALEMFRCGERGGIWASNTCFSPGRPTPTEAPRVERSGATTVTSICQGDVLVKTTRTANPRGPASEASTTESCYWGCSAGACRNATLEEAQVYRYSVLQNAIEREVIACKNTAGDARDATGCTEAAVYDKAINNLKPEELSPTIKQVFNDSAWVSQDVKNQLVDQRIDEIKKAEAARPVYVPRLSEEEIRRQAESYVSDYLESGKLRPGGDDTLSPDSPEYQALVDYAKQNWFLTGLSLNKEFSANLFAAGMSALVKGGEVMGNKLGDQFSSYFQERQVKEEALINCGLKGWEARLTLEQDACFKGESLVIKANNAGLQKEREVNAALQVVTGILATMTGGAGGALAKGAPKLVGLAAEVLPQVGVDMAAAPAFADLYSREARNRAAIYETLANSGAASETEKAVWSEQAEQAAKQADERYRSELVNGFMMAVAVNVGFEGVGRAAPKIFGDSAVGKVLFGSDREAAVAAKTAADGFNAEILTSDGTRLVAREEVLGAEAIIGRGGTVEFQTPGGSVYRGEMAGSAKAVLENSPQGTAVRTNDGEIFVAVGDGTYRGFTAVGGELPAKVETVAGRVVTVDDVLAARETLAAVSSGRLTGEPMVAVSEAMPAGAEVIGAIPAGPLTTGNLFDRAGQIVGDAVDQLAEVPAAVGDAVGGATTVVRNAADDAVDNVRVFTNCGIAMTPIPQVYAAGKGGCITIKPGQADAPELGDSVSVRVDVDAQTVEVHDLGADPVVIRQGDTVVLPSGKEVRVVAVGSDGTAVVKPTGAGFPDSAVSAEELATAVKGNLQDNPDLLSTVGPFVKTARDMLENKPDVIVLPGDSASRYEDAIHSIAQAFETGDVPPIVAFPTKEQWITMEVEIDGQTVEVSAVLPGPNLLAYKNLSDFMGPTGEKAGVRGLFNTADRVLENRLKLTPHDERLLEIQALLKSSREEYHRTDLWKPSTSFRRTLLELFYPEQMAIINKARSVAFFDDVSLTGKKLCCYDDLFEKDFAPSIERYVVLAEKKASIPVGTHIGATESVAEYPFLREFIEGEGITTRLVKLHNDAFDYERLFTGSPAEKGLQRETFFTTVEQFTKGQPVLPSSRHAQEYIQFLQEEVKPPMGVARIRNAAEEAAEGIRNAVEQVLGINQPLGIVAPGTAIVDDVFGGIKARIGKGDSLDDLVGPAGAIRNGDFLQDVLLDPVVKAAVDLTPGRTYADKVRAFLENDPPKLTLDPDGNRVPLDSNDIVKLKAASSAGLSSGEIPVKIVTPDGEGPPRTLYEVLSCPISWGGFRIVKVAYAAGKGVCVPSISSDRTIVRPDDSRDGLHTVGELGNGGFGKVEDTGFGEVAKTALDPERAVYLREEMGWLENANRQGFGDILPKVTGEIQDPDGRFVGYMMDKIQGVTLDKFGYRIPNDVTDRFYRRLADLDQAGLLHRDIFARNVMVVLEADPTVGVGFKVKGLMLLDPIIPRGEVAHVGFRGILAEAYTKLGFYQTESLADGSIKVFVPRKNEKAGRAAINHHNLLVEHPRYSQRESRLPDGDLRKIAGDTQDPIYHRMSGNEPPTSDELQSLKGSYQQVKNTSGTSLEATTDDVADALGVPCNPVTFRLVPQAYAGSRDPCPITLLGSNNPAAKVGKAVGDFFGGEELPVRTISSADEDIAEAIQPFFKTPLSDSPRSTAGRIRGGTTTATVIGDPANPKGLVLESQTTGLVTIKPKVGEELSDAEVQAIVRQLKDTHPNGFAVTKPTQDLLDSVLNKEGFISDNDGRLFWTPDVKPRPLAVPSGYTVSLVEKDGLRYFSVVKDGQTVAAVSYDPTTRTILGVQAIAGEETAAITTVASQLSRQPDFAGIAVSQTITRDVSLASGLRGVGFIHTPTGVYSYLPELISLPNTFQKIGKGLVAFIGLAGILTQIDREGTVVHQETKIIDSEDEKPIPQFPDIEIQRGDREQALKDPVTANVVGTIHTPPRVEEKQTAIETPIRSQMDSVSKLENIAESYVASTEEEAIEVARGIDFIPFSNFEDPSNMCGPLAISILRDAGIIDNGIDVSEFWLLNPRVDARLIEETFPQDQFSFANYNIPISQYNFSSNPLKPGDLLYLFAGPRDNFEHVLTVSRVDDNGRAYSVTNVRSPSGEMVITEVILYDPERPGEGQFYKWSVQSATGLTGGGGFSLWRRNDSAAVNPDMGGGREQSILLEGTSAAGEEILAGSGFAGQRLSEESDVQKQEGDHRQTESNGGLQVEVDDGIAKISGDWLHDSNFLNMNATNKQIVANRKLIVNNANLNLGFRLGNGVITMPAMNQPAERLINQSDARANQISTGRNIIKSVAAIQSIVNQLVSAAGGGSRLGRFGDETENQAGQSNNSSNQIELVKYSPLHDIDESLAKRKLAHQHTSEIPSPQYNPGRLVMSTPWNNGMTNVAKNRSPRLPNISDSRSNWANVHDEDFGIKEKSNTLDDLLSRLTPQVYAAEGSSARIMPLSMYRALAGQVLLRKAMEGLAENERTAEKIGEAVLGAAAVANAIPERGALSSNKAGYWAVSGTEGIAAGTVGKGIYLVTADPVAGIDLILPAKINVGVNGDGTVMVGVTEGRGRVKVVGGLEWWEKPMLRLGEWINKKLTNEQTDKLTNKLTKAQSGTVLAAESEAAVATVPLTVQLYIDENKNGKMDQGEESAKLAGVKVNLVAETKTVSYKLTEGWNFVAFPVVPESVKTAAELVQDVALDGGYVTTVATWEGDKWLEFSQRGAEKFGQDFELQPGRAYFLNSHAESMWALAGTPLPEENRALQLRKGWNGVGLPEKVGTAVQFMDDLQIRGEVSETSRRKVSETAETADQAARWEFGLWEVVVKRRYSPEHHEIYGRDFPIKPEEGYFIHANEDVRFQ